MSCSKFEKSKFDERKLKQLHERIAKLRFFDPACGCGNFLIITYRELRLLEIAILKQLRTLSGRASHQLVVDIKIISRIDVDAMYGIEDRGISRPHCRGCALAYRPPDEHAAFGRVRAELCQVAA